MGKGRTATNQPKYKKLILIYKALYPRDNLGTQFVSRKEERRGFASTEDSANASIWRIKDYIKKEKKTNYSDQKQHG